MQTQRVLHPEQRPSKQNSFQTNTKFLQYQRERAEKGVRKTYYAQHKEQILESLANYRKTHPHYFQEYREVRVSWSKF